MDDLLVRRLNAKIETMSPTELTRVVTGHMLIRLVRGHDHADRWLVHRLLPDYEIEEWHGSE